MTILRRLLTVRHQDCPIALEDYMGLVEERHEVTREIGRMQALRLTSLWTKPEQDRYDELCLREQALIDRLGLQEWDD